MGNGKCLYIFFIGVDLWLIFIFQGWEMGNVLESGIHIYSGVDMVDGEAGGLRCRHRSCTFKDEIAGWCGSDDARCLS